MRRPHMQEGWQERGGQRALLVFEVITVAVLSMLVLLALFGLFMEIPSVLKPPFLTGEALSRVLEHVLTVFVLIELLATAVAYIRGFEVLRRIFEAVFLAIVRKLISLDLSSGALEKSIALGVLLVASAVAWWLVVRERSRP